MPGEKVRLQPGEVPEKDRTLRPLVTEEFKDDLDNIEANGIQWGDLVTHMTTALGIPPCPKCVKRGRILNRVRALGWREVVRRLKEVK